ncbi:GET complex, subunit GET2 [Cordyceps fumosorosea ARSEF 2679]|uniref:GET complex, subunit GET2 n=1 Tax=Cordyceps fumosorosea (strain ARSEF 2679) TaxID=1081104 RepID=A0A162MU57_CORFA|nr:GET complex, subunit GET2 [Cordyceps fumosorosea ARSEF 2679]OAA70459.1 GET complex, subunit GET2 [Cordyceps fumosorosea ARSEF 2679]
MTEGVSSSSDAAAERAAEQARLRKERREAKIKAGGSSRLNKITGIGGRIVGDNDQAVPEAPTDTTTTTAAAEAATPKPAAVEDPDEVDISEHYYSPGAARLLAQQQQRAGAMPSPAATGDFPLPPDGMTEEQHAQLRQLMLGGGQPPAGVGEEDPLMKMMSQMMGGAGGAGGGFPGMPGGADATSPFASMMGGAQQQPAAAAATDVYGTVWRIVHALLALGLGLYVVLATPFDGTLSQRQLAFKLEQQPGGADDDVGASSSLDGARNNFFWAFATAEAVLLTTKFFLDKGRAPPPGFLWSVAGQLPAPWRGYVVNVMRYGQIFTTVRTDILLCAFVLGVCAWWKGQL